ncbi:hypothetical protein BJ978_001590 [Agromyces terreus]|uniref:Nuclear transport factor 2 family protein n=1 Tax=Agromyces terreus TaxID=424795 RepID=A0A9X2KBS0_9MICO|nr:hypothetical protein [Agromyces terreus]MCP2370914.1 hypothetical protein [Agromyces terreus]
MPNLRSRQLVLAAALAALTITLSGCLADANPSPSASPPPSESAPIFATDEEALAAAVAAYDAYLDVAQQVGEDGGAEPDRIRAAVTDEYADEEIPNYASLGDNDYRIVGRGTLGKATLMERTDSTVHIYGCVGVGTSRVIDGDGKDVTPTGRPQSVPLELTFQIDNGELLLSSSDVWPGDDFC